MKKSEMYHILQLMVVRDVDVEAEPTLEILRELMRQEDLAAFSEASETAVKGE